jgi:hypothetical protein
MLPYHPLNQDPQALRQLVNRLDEQGFFPILKERPALPLEVRMAIETSMQLFISSVGDSSKSP